MSIQTASEFRHPAYKPVNIEEESIARQPVRIA
jgi:hypothetical protein